MSRRFREGDGHSGDADVPYGPSEPAELGGTAAGDPVDERKVPL
jgi:hypothetical protein